MIQIKKTILTLVALLAVTTGAWAQGPWTSGACTVTLNNGTLTVSGNGAMDDYPNLDMPWDGNKGAITSVVVESGVTSVGMGAFYSFENMTSVTLPEGLTAINDMAFNDCSSLQSITLPEGLTAISPNAFTGCSSLQSITIPSTVTSIGTDAFYSCSAMTSITLPEGLTAIGGLAFASCSSLTSVTIPSTVTSIADMAFIFCSVMSDVYIYAPSLTTYGADAFNYNATGRKIHVLSDAVDTYKAGWPAYAADIMGDLQPLASGPKVAWNKAEKTGSFKMPGGNVTLEPEYYPQAALTAAPTAIDNVPATTDGAIVSAGTVKNIGETTTAQGTVMYYVSPTALDDAALLALAADKWTADVPTAAGLAQGQAYVYYYVRGNDSNNDDENFSDGDIAALPVTIAAEPTYAVTFADGVNPEPPAEPEWTASPAADVKKGQTVTVTYSGERKVMGVKAEKKAAGTPLGNPLTIEAITPGTIKVKIGGELTTGMKYSVNGGTPTLITTTTNIEGLKAGDKVQFYGNGTQTQVYGDFPEVSIQGSGDGFKTKVYGNIMSLLDEEGFATKTDLPNTSYVFYGLFKQNSTLIDASELLLPATTLTTACYQVMFQECTSLTTAPKLPATTLTTSCYYAMFSGCTSLTNAYVKAVYTDYDNASSDMFIDCTATGAVLHTAPGSKASWEAKMGTGKSWSNWTVADDWEE